MSASLSAADRRRIRGCLEVRALVPSRMGTGDRLVSAGSVGYVEGRAPSGHWLVFWPFIAREYAGDWRSGSHDPLELEPTGRRG